MDEISGNEGLFKNSFEANSNSNQLLNNDMNCNEYGFKSDENQPKNVNEWPVESLRSSGLSTASHMSIASNESFGQMSTSEESDDIVSYLSSYENTENDSFMANVSDSFSPLFSAEINPLLKRPVLRLNTNTNTPKIRKTNSMVFASKKKRTSFVRSFSANEAQIKKAVEMSCAIPSLIGDCSKPYALPLVQGRHQDLKSISVDVLAQVLDGHFNDSIEECVVVDCRYPYEFNGGHIRGAKNIYSREAILQEFIRSKTSAPAINTTDNKRHILVFHCEFSSERGPTLSRFLRNNDRSHNKDLYPQLHHPEIYLLEGGYKAFFERYPNLCEPSNYLPMLSKDHEQELKRFRSLVKSLSTDGKYMSCAFKTGN